MNSGYPGNGDIPSPYVVLNVTTQSKSPKFNKVKRTGKAYWSGNRWIGVGGFKVSEMQSKVIKWEVV